MNYLLNESKLNDLILNYINQNFHPDYDWGPELHDFYRNEIDKYGVYNFTIDEERAYDFHEDWGAGPELVVHEFVTDQLNGYLENVGLLFLKIGLKRIQV
jgi:hypothetical protein